MPRGAIDRFLSGMVGQRISAECSNARRLALRMLAAVGCILLVTLPISARGDDVVVIMVCLEDTPLWDDHGSDECRWTELPDPSAMPLDPIPLTLDPQALASPVDLTGADLADEDDETARYLPGMATGLDFAGQVLQPLGREFGNVTLSMLHYQAVPDQSFLWRLDEYDPTTMIHAMSVGIARPDDKHQLARGRFKRFGFRLYFSY